MALEMGMICATPSQTVQYSGGESDDEVDNSMSKMLSKHGGSKKKRVQMVSDDDSYDHKKSGQGQLTSGDINLTSNSNKKKGRNGTASVSQDSEDMTSLNRTDTAKSKTNAVFNDGNYQMITKKPDYEDDRDVDDMIYNMQHKGHGHKMKNEEDGKKGGRRTQTLLLYEKFKRIKERNRQKVIDEMQAEEKTMKMNMIKKGVGNELQGLSSFDKQEDNNEFQDFMNREYNTDSKIKQGRQEVTLASKSLID